MWKPLFVGGGLRQLHIVSQPAIERVLARMLGPKETQSPHWRVWKPLSVSSGFELLQMVSQPVIGQCARENAWFTRGSIPIFEECGNLSLLMVDLDCYKWYQNPRRAVCPAGMLSP